MLLFEIASVLILFAVLVMTTYMMVHIMKFCESFNLHFIPSALITTFFGVVMIAAKSAFLLDVLRMVCGV